MNQQQRRLMRLATVATFSLFAALQACTCAEKTEKKPPLPTKRVDSGFTMENDAFSFPNFGGPDSDSRVDQHSMIRMHGKDAICAADEDNCRVRPIAKEYIRAVNDGVQGGRCEGFALMSSMLFQGELNPADFGAETTAELSLDGNEDLGNEIAYWFATQYLRDVVADSTTPLSAEDAVRFLNAEFSKDAHDMFRLGIARVDENGRLTGGHAVLPIAVAPGDGDGKYTIYLYDNNHPGEERELYVDINDGNKWEYLAATNPDAPGANYVGNDDNGNLLYLAKLEPRIGRHTCSFCTAPDGEAAMQQVFGSAGVEINAENADGNVTGEREGRLLREIPGSAVVPLLSDNFEDDTGSISTIPVVQDANNQLILNISGSGTPQQSGEQTVALFGEDTMAVVDEILVNDDEEATMTVDTDTNTVSFAPDPEAETPGGSVTFAATTEDGDDVLVKAELPTDDSGSTASSLSMTVDPVNGDTTVETEGVADGTLTNITVETSNETGGDTLTGQIPATEGGSTTVLVSEFEDGDETIGAERDTDGDGTADETVEIIDVGPDPVAPAAPTNLVASNVTQDSVQLTWTDNADNEGNQIVRRDAGAGFVAYATLAANLQTFTDSAITPGADYRYEVVAVNAYGNSAASNIVEVTAVACEPGTAIENDACAACGPGEFCAGGNAPRVACAAGSYDDDESALTACVVCVEGEFCQGGTFPPEPCVAGTSDHDNSAATACQMCVAGQFCPGGSDDAQACVAGTTDADASPLTVCDVCAPGTFCPGGIAPAVFCEPGTADRDFSAATACDVCTFGEFCPGGDAPATLCGPGTADQDIDPATPCDPCTAGQYCPGDGIFELCFAGSADDDLNPVTACLICTPGQFCAGETARPVFCAQTGGFDNDSDPTTPCLPCQGGTTPTPDGLACEVQLGEPTVTTVTTFGDANDDLPVGSGELLDVAVGADGRIFAASTYGTDFDVLGTPLSGARFSTAIVALNPDGQVFGFVDLHSSDPTGDMMVRRIKMDPNTGDMFVVGAGRGGNGLIAGTSIGAMNADPVGFVARISSTQGSLVWGSVLQGAGNISQVNGIDFGTDGRVYITGSYVTSLALGAFNLGTAQPGQEDVFVATLDGFSGEPLGLFQASNGAAGERANGIAVLLDGNLAIVGDASGPGLITIGGANAAPPNSNDAFAAVFTPVGAMIGFSLAATPNSERFLNVERLHRSNDVIISGQYDGGTVVGGVTLGTASFGTVLTRMQPNGIHVWVDGQSGGGGSGFGSRRFVVTGDDEVFMIDTMGSSGTTTFGGTPVPQLSSAHRIIRVAGSSGAVQTLTTLDTTVGASLNSVAIGFPDTLTSIGAVTGAGTFGGLNVATNGNSRDHLVFQAVVPYTSAPLILENGGFESPVLAPGQTGPADGVGRWVTGGSAANLFRPNGGFIVPGDGAQVVRIGQNGLLQQQLPHTYRAGKRYTVSGQIASENFGNPLDIELAFANQNLLLPQGGQAMAPWSFTFDVLPGDLLVGQSVFISLQAFPNSLGTTAIIDAVTITERPLP